jgi:hypothetical protein
MKQPENQSKKYSALFNDIDGGKIKVPQFQRDFVWYKAQTAKLIDSILKGFPIGTFILWKTKERLRHMRNIVLVDDYLNKRVIKAKPPSEYVQAFLKQNPDLEDTLGTHYIGSPQTMGIWEDDYKTFLSARAELISTALNQALAPDVT